MIWTVAKKELRGYFNSAVALIFLAAFLVGTLYTFFWHEKFFARGLADLRPLFEWMPKLLIILVSALAMRLWAEERRAGTLEILLTLPVERWKLVAGKFLAGMVLIAVALALTLGIPITVSQMGNLDTGPVIGGYLATLLLAAAYLVIGMCISAATDIQIVAFVGTAAVCIVTYLVGELGDIGRAFGTGARFESVARGVIDLRDLAYYAGIVCIGVSLNVLLLGRMTWGRSPRARERRYTTILSVTLIAANAIALGIWMAPVRKARIDLTQDGAYSLSPATTRILQGAEERLLIRGYFSEKTHPELAPLIPRMRDLLDEYRVAGGSKVRVEIIDPADDEDAKREAKERFDIEPRPVQFETKDEASIVNVYFAIAIQYGDQHEVLKLSDLIQERRLPGRKSEVLLKNPEYAITKSIKKALTSFSSVESLFASMPGKVTLTAYVTPNTLPDNWKGADQKLKAVVDQLIKDSGNKLEYKTVEPKTEPEMVELYNKYGLRPYMDAMGGNPYYFHMVLAVGDRLVRIVPPENVGDAGLKTSIIDGLKRGSPGFTRVVGMWTPPGGAPIGLDTGMPQEGTPPPQTFDAIKQSLSDNYEVKDVALTVPVPDDIEVLLLCGPTALDAKAVDAIDQFVMRGGSLVVLAGRYRFSFGRGKPELEKVSTGLEPLFAAWGITVLDQVVLDAKNEKFMAQQTRDDGVAEASLIDYPYFVRMDDRQLASSVITAGLPGSVMMYASPVDAKPQVGDDAHEVTALLQSSDKSWLATEALFSPDRKTYAASGFPPPGDNLRPHSLAVSVVGGFTSGSKGEPGTAAARKLQHSPPSTRVAVFGSSVFASDLMLGYAQDRQMDLALSNLLLVHNTVDWALADTDLLEIRAHGASARALTVEADSRENWRFLNIVIALVALGGVVLIAFLRRRAVTPIIGKGAA